MITHDSHPSNGWHGVGPLQKLIKIAVYSSLYSSLQATTTYLSTNEVSDILEMVFLIFTATEPEDSQKSLRGGSDGSRSFPAVSGWSQKNSVCYWHWVEGKIVAKITDSFLWGRWGMVKWTKAERAVKKKKKKQC